MKRIPKPAARPNILWISNEDVSPHLGVYGDPLARTPKAIRYGYKESDGTRVVFTR